VPAAVVFSSRLLAGAASTFLRAARAAAEQDADFVVRPVALMNANFLALAFRNVDEFGGHGHAGGLFQQGPDTAAQRAAGHIGTPLCILDDGIIRTADFQRAFARADMEAALAKHFAFEDQLTDQLQFRLCCVSAHVTLSQFTIRYMQRIFYSLYTRRIFYSL